MAAVYVTYWALRPHRNARQLLLLVASYTFYMCWKPQYALLILTSTLIDYGVGLGLQRVQDRRGRKALLCLSLLGNLSLLGLFKYYGFFAASASQALQWMGATLALPKLDLLLPVGI